MNEYHETPKQFSLLDLGMSGHYYLALCEEVHQHQSRSARTTARMRRPIESACCEGQSKQQPDHTKGSFRADFGFGTKAVAGSPVDSSRY